MLLQLPIIIQLLISKISLIGDDFVLVHRHFLCYFHQILITIQLDKPLKLGRSRITKAVIDFDDLNLVILEILVYFIDVINILKLFLVTISTLPIHFRMILQLLNIFYIFQERRRSTPETLFVL